MARFAHRLTLYLIQPALHFNRSRAFRFVRLQLLGELQYFLRKLKLVEKLLAKSGIGEPEARALRFGPCNPLLQ